MVVTTAGIVVGSWVILAIRVVGVRTSVNYTAAVVNLGLRVVVGSIRKEAPRRREHALTRLGRVGHIVESARVHAPSV